METAEKLGKYAVKLGDAELEKHLGGAWMSQELDGFSTLVVQVNGTPENLAKWRLASYPQKAEFECGGKTLFRGTFASAEARGASTIVLTYGDDLRLAAKKSCDQFGKQQRLEDVLRKIADTSEMRARFLGDFSEALPAFPQGGVSLLGLLQSLADKHGFFFVTRSVADEIVFLRPGQSTSSASIDEKKVAAINFRQSGSESFEKLGVRYFDDAALEGKSAQMSSEQLYQPLSGFTEGSQFKEKQGWKSAKGHLEMQVTDKGQFDRSQAWFAAHFSKRALAQETITLDTFEPLALPGDKLSVKGSPLPAIEDGNYFVASLTVEIGSALPKCRITAIRP